MSNFYNNNALPVLLVVLFWFSVSVEFSVFGDNSVPLAVGVNDAKNSRPSGKRVPSTINEAISHELQSAADLLLCYCY